MSHFKSYLDHLVNNIHAAWHHVLHGFCPRRYPLRP